MMNLKYVESSIRGLIQGNFFLGGGTEQKQEKRENIQFSGLDLNSELSEYEAISCEFLLLGTVFIDQRPTTVSDEPNVLAAGYVCCEFEHLF
jgi:hypothetical protein